MTNKKSSSLTLSEELLGKGFLRRPLSLIGRAKIGKFVVGAQGGTRTRKARGQRILSPSCIPIPPPGPNFLFVYFKNLVIIG